MRRKTCFLSIIVLFVLLALPLIVQAEASSTMWIQTYGGDGWDSVEAVIQTSDGGYALAGRTKSFGSGGYEFWLIKTDSLGNVEWNKTYGAGSALSIVQTSDGGYTIAGSMLVKTDSEGNMQWKRNYGEGSAWAMALTRDGGYIIACSSLVKIDSEDNIQWNQPYEHKYGAARCVIQTSDGGYALAGTGRVIIDNDLAGYYAWLIKTDPEGNIPENTRLSLGFLALGIALLVLKIAFQKRENRKQNSPT